MWNWNITHGGPYYVEVGKNISIKYLATENVSVIVSNPYNNASNDTNVTTV